MLYLLQFLFRIVDQGAEFTLILFTQGIAEEFVHLTLDITRCIFQYVQKGLILAVNVSEKMLCAFRQIENSLQIDNLRASLSYGWKRLCE